MAHARELRPQKGERFGTLAIDPGTTAQLLALLAHDLRNPLSALHSNVGYLSAMLGGGDQDIVEALADARVSCDSLVMIIDNLELLGRVLGEAPAPGKTRLALAPVVDAVVQQHRGLAQSHGTSIELAAVDRGIQVDSNREMLSRALGNLICNAIQYSPTGSPISVKAMSSSGTCVVSVSDRGPAFDQSLGELAFTAAGQSELKSASGGRYGRGLGLFAAQVAAAAAGAQVRARGNRSEGAVFELQLTADIG